MRKLLQINNILSVVNLHGVIGQYTYTPYLLVVCGRIRRNNQSCKVHTIGIISTQLKFIRNKVARRLKDTHENNDEKQTNKTIKKSKNNNSNRDMFKSQYSAE